MQITERNLNRILKIPDTATRKAKLQEFCLSIGFHGGPWVRAMEELEMLNQQGVKTPLENAIQAT